VAPCDGNELKTISYDEESGCLLVLSRTPNDCTVISSLVF
jgi:hypothetical protein